MTHKGIDTLKTERLLLQLFKRVLKPERNFETSENPKEAIANYKWEDAA